MKFAVHLKRAIVPLILILLVALVITSFNLERALTPKRVLTVAVLDVGQGDSIYIESPTGRQVVLDAGPDDSLLLELPKVMPPFDRSIDVAIATHPDADHIAGFVELLRRYEVEMFIEPRIIKETLTAKALENEVDVQHLPRYAARRGMWLDLGGGARLEFLYPDFDPLHIGSDKANDGGIVAKLIYGDTSVLLMADVSKKVESRLLVLNPEALRSTILKVGHHGSRTSSSLQFVAAAGPAAAVISLGKNNKYHFPTAEAIANLEEYSGRILRTDEEGTIVLQSNGKKFVMVR